MVFSGSYFRFCHPLDEYFVERGENFLKPYNSWLLLKEKPEQITTFFFPVKPEGISALALL